MENAGQSKIDKDLNNLCLTSIIFFLLDFCEKNGQHTRGQARHTLSRSISAETHRMRKKWASKGIFLK